MRAAVQLWIGVTLLGSLIILATFRSAETKVPVQVADWCRSALRALEEGRPLPPAPTAVRTFRLPHPAVLSEWRRGALTRRAAPSRSPHKLIVQTARGRTAKSETRGARYVLEVVQDTHPLPAHVPFITELSLVSLRDGLVLQKRRSRTTYVTPSQLFAAKAFGGVPTPLPDVRFGVNIQSWLSEPHLSVRRARFTTIEATADATGRQAPLVESEATLEQAIEDAVGYLIRLQRPDGSFVYLYDAVTDREVPAPYNLPRHAGTTYFLAQAANFLRDNTARQAALRAVGWLKTHHLKQCGGAHVLCVGDDRTGNVGATALTLLAASELLRGKREDALESLVEKLSRFLRSMQRSDGDLMHLYNLQKQEPLNVQRLYYSGEAAYALAHACSVRGRGGDCRPLQKLLPKITTASWSFLGSRYYYGEEHWTCQAVAIADAHLELAKPLSFCRRWAAYNGKLQYTGDVTPWQAQGAYGVGPILVPLLAPTASRTEAHVLLYRAVLRRQQVDPELRDQIKRSIGFLLRLQWRPGPTFAMRNPQRASGGFPASAESSVARIDYVQHAGSAMVAWARLLRDERLGLVGHAPRYMASGEHSFTSREGRTQTDD